MTGQTPPGWYPDPQGPPGLQRWWDGGQWTSSTQPAAGQGAGTPEPWQPPSTPQPSIPQPSTPQPWAPQQAGPAAWGGGTPPGAPRKNQGLLFALLGGGALVLVLAAVAIFFVVRSGDDDPKTTDPSTSVAAPPGNGRSPVVGTITDEKSGLSWAQLGGGWTVEKPLEPTSTYGKLGLIKGEQVVVQKDYTGPGKDYVATVFSAVLPDGVYYADGNLEGAAKSWFGSVRPGFYPEHTVSDVASRAYSVSGKKAWYYEVKISFPQAQTQGWNFQTERAIIVLVDRSGGQPAGLYMSIPDSHRNQGDIQAVLDSLKAT